MAIPLSLLKKIEDTEKKLSAQKIVEFLATSPKYPKQAETVKSLIGKKPPEWILQQLKSAEVIDDTSGLPQEPAAEPSQVPPGSPTSSAVPIAPIVGDSPAISPETIQDFASQEQQIMTERGTPAPTTPNVDVSRYAAKRSDRTYVPPADIALSEPMTVGSTLKRGAKDYGAGVAGMITGAGGAAKAIGLEAIGKMTSDYGNEMMEYYAVKDPNFLDNVVKGFGSMSTFFVPGLGIAKGVGAITQVPRLATWLGITASSLMEASIEGGSTYESMISQGKSHKEAQWAATKVFAANVPTLIATNKLSNLFDLAPGNILKKTFTGGGMEGTQEALQEIISTKGESLAKPINKRDVIESGAIGAITGGGVGVVTQKLENIDAQNTPEAQAQKVSETFDAQKTEPGKRTGFVMPDKVESEKTAYENFKNKALSEQFGTQIDESVAQAEASKAPVQQATPAEVELSKTHDVIAKEVQSDGSTIPLVKKKAEPAIPGVIPAETTTDVVSPEITKIIEENGGINPKIWKEQVKDGKVIQKTQVQFDDAKSGSTFNIPIDGVTPESVKAKIDEFNAQNTQKQTITDPAEVQKIKNSIAEGELTLRTRKFNGRTLDETELNNVRMQVNRQKEKIGIKVDYQAKSKRKVTRGTATRKYKEQTITPENKPYLEYLVDKTNELNAIHDILSNPPSKPNNSGYEGISGITGKAKDVAILIEKYLSTEHLTNKQLETLKSNVESRIDWFEEGKARFEGQQKPKEDLLTVQAETPKGAIKATKDQVEPQKTLEGFTPKQAEAELPIETKPKKVTILQKRADALIEDIKSAYNSPNRHLMDIRALRKEANTIDKLGISLGGAMRLYLDEIEKAVKESESRLSPRKTAKRKEAKVKEVKTIAEAESPLQVRLKEINSQIDVLNKQGKIQEAIKLAQEGNKIRQEIAKKKPTRGNYNIPQPGMEEVTATPEKSKKYTPPEYPGVDRDKPDAWLYDVIKANKGLGIETSIRKNIPRRGDEVLGVFYPRQRKVILNAKLANKESRLIYVAAHEGATGHGGDRGSGNILGHISSIQKYMSNSISELMGSSELNITSDVRVGLKSRAISEVMKNRGFAIKEGKPKGVAMAYYAKLKEIANLKVTEAIKKDVSERYRELVKEYAKENGFVLKDEMTEELQKVSEWIDPFDKTISAEYTDYRNLPRELIADASAVYMINRKAIKIIAPKFAKMYESWLENKPEVKAQMDKFEERLAMPEKERYKSLRQDISKGIKEQENVVKELAEKTDEFADNTLPSKVTRFVDILINELWSERYIAKKLTRGLGFTLDNNPMDTIANSNYLVGGIPHNLMQDYAVDVFYPLKDAGIAYEDAGTYAYAKTLLENKEIMVDDGGIVLVADKNIVGAEGLTKATAQGVIDDIKDTYGEEKFKALEKAMDNFYKINKKALDYLYNEHEITKEIYDTALVNPFWTRTAIAEKLKSSNVRMSNKQRVGSVKLPLNPITATMLSYVNAIKSAIAHQTAKEYVDKVFRAIGDEKNFIPVKRDDKGVVIPKKGYGVVEYKEKGVRKAFYVDPYIAHILTDFQPRETIKALKIIAILGNIGKDLCTTVSLPFQILSNPQRDFGGQVEMMGRGGYIPSLIKVLKYRKRSFKYAIEAADFANTWRRLIGVPHRAKKLSPYLRKMQEEGALDLSRSRYSDLATKAELTDYNYALEILRQYGIEGFDTADRADLSMKAFVKNPAGTAKNAVAELGSDLFNIISRWGLAMESWGTISNDMMLSDMGFSKKARIAINRERGGKSPDFRHRAQLSTRGFLSPFLWFITPIQRDLDRFITVGTEKPQVLEQHDENGNVIGEIGEPRTRVGYWWKVMMTAGISTIPLLLAKSGDLDDYFDKILAKMGSKIRMNGRWENWADNVPSYYARNNNIAMLPIMDSEGKSVIVRTWVSEQNRLLKTIMYNFGMDNYVIPKKTGKKAPGIVDQTLNVASNVFNYMGLGVSVNPAISLVSDWSEYFKGMNPHDMWRGRDVLPYAEGELIKGGGQVFATEAEREIMAKSQFALSEPFKTMLLYSLDKMAFQLEDYGFEGYRTVRSSSEDPSRSDFEHYLNKIPVFNSMIRVVSGGEREYEDIIEKYEKTFDATESIAENKAIRQSVSERRKARRK